MNNNQNLTQNILTQEVDKKSLQNDTKDYEIIKKIPGKIHDIQSDGKTMVALISSDKKNYIEIFDKEFKSKIIEVKGSIYNSGFLDNGKIYYNAPYETITLYKIDKIAGKIEVMRRITPKEYSRNLYVKSGSLGPGFIFSNDSKREYAVSEEGYCESYYDFATRYISPTQLLVWEGGDHFTIVDIKTQRIQHKNFPKLRGNNEYIHDVKDRIEGGSGPWVVGSVKENGDIVVTNVLTDEERNYNLGCSGRTYRNYKYSNKLKLLVGMEIGGTIYSQYLGKEAREKICMKTHIKTRIFQSWYLVENVCIMSDKNTVYMVKLTEQD